MLSKLRTRLTFANVVSMLALFVALGGSSYAAIKVTGKNVKDSSLTGKDVKNSSLTTSDVKNGSLLSSDFKAGQLPAGAQGPQGDKGDKGDPGAPNPNATNSDKLDNLDSSDFLRSNGKAADSETVDGLDSSQLVQGGGRTITRWRTPSQGTSSSKATSANWEVWYDCPTDLTTNGTLNYKNISNGTNLYVDNGGPNPVRFTVLSGQTHSEPASPGGDAFDLDVSGGNSISHLRVATSHAQSQGFCSFQVIAIELGNS